MRPNIVYDVPSTAETIGKFFIDIFLYFLLAFYFDHVDESNRGKHYDYLFFLKKNYWFSNNKIPNRFEELPKSITALNEDLESENYENQSEKRNSSITSKMNINSANSEQKLLDFQVGDLLKNGILKI